MAEKKLEIALWIALIALLGFLGGLFFGASTIDNDFESYELSPRTDSNVYGDGVPVFPVGSYTIKIERTK